MDFHSFLVWLEQILHAPYYEDRVDALARSLTGLALLATLLRSLIYAVGTGQEDTPKPSALIMVSILVAVIWALPRRSSKYTLGYVNC